MQYSNKFETICPPSYSLYTLCTSTTKHFEWCREQYAYIIQKGSHHTSSGAQCLLPIENNLESSPKNSSPTHWVFCIFFPRFCHCRGWSPPKCTTKHPKLPSSQKSTGSWRLHLLRDFWLTHTLHKLVDACLAKGLEFQKVLVKKRVLLAKGHVRTLLGHSCGTIPLHCSKTKFSLRFTKCYLLVFDRQWPARSHHLRFSSVRVSWVCSSCDLTSPQSDFRKYSNHIGSSWIIKSIKMVVEQGNF